MAKKIILLSDGTGNSRRKGLAHECVAGVSGA